MDTPEDLISATQMMENPILKKMKVLEVKARELQKTLVDLISSTNDLTRLDKFEIYLEWLNTKTNKIKEEPTFDTTIIPELNRGDVILVDLGFNIGEEFGGEHPAIVLRNCRQANKSVTILPITSQEPKNKDIPIYVRIGKIHGLNQDYHWANIVNLRSISKQRIIYPPEPKKVDGVVLNRMSQTIKSQIALLKDIKKDN